MRDIQFVQNSNIIDFCQQHAEIASKLIKHGLINNRFLSLLARLTVAPIADFISKRWLVKQNNPYLAEINAFSSSLNIPGVYAVNLSYEWGCSSVAFKQSTGPHLLRILDWPFTGLGENIYVLEQKSQYGNFYNVTWPGLSGIYQATAPGRFAIAINQAPMRIYGSSFVYSWFKNRIIHWRQKSLPPSHLLRHVFENAKDYTEAKQMLCATPICMPVFFILSGTEEHEGCVIERLENDAVVRNIDDSNQVSVTNHFQTRLQIQPYAWKSRALDSNLRAAKIRCPNNYTDFNCLEYPLVSHLTRITMHANAATGKLSVQGWEASGPATNVLDLTLKA